jgi:type I restriction enzyme S subunit
MKNGWQTKTLGAVCEVMNGGTPKTGVPEYWDGKHRWITPAEMGKRLSPYVSETERMITALGLRNSSAQMLPPHSVILSSRAPIGHLVINTEPMATNQGCKGLIPGSQVQHKFLYYYLTSIVDLLNSLGTGATFKELSGGKLKEVTIPIPPLPEQQRIVGLLDEAFAGITTTKANAEKNLQNAHALFESHVESVFTQRGKTWVEKRLEEVCVFVNGRAYKKDEMLSAGKYPLLRVGNFFTNKDWYYSDLELDADKYCDTGDLLYAWSASFGPRIWDGGKVIYHYHIWKVLPNSAVVEKRFLLHLLEWDVEQIKQAHGTGTTMMHVSKGSMESRVVPIPPLKEQASIVSRLDNLTIETQRLASFYERKLAALEALKKSLLHEAFTGQLPKTA